MRQLLCLKYARVNKIFWFVGDDGFALEVMGLSLLLVFSPTCFSSFDKRGLVPWWALGDCQVSEQGHNLKELHLTFSLCHRTLHSVHAGEHSTKPYLSPPLHRFPYETLEQ